MKKKYSKPGIFIEDFRVAEHIAGCPGVKHDNLWGTPKTGSPSSCIWLGKEGNQYFLENSSCTVPVKENGDGTGDFGIFCYNGPVASMLIFGS